MAFTSSQIASASLGLKIGGAITSAAGAYYDALGGAASMRSQARIAEANAQIMDTNARIAELGAQAELRAGQQRIGEVTRRAGQVKSAQRAAMAANGIDLGVGSAAEVQASTDVMKDLDVATLEANAMRAAWGARFQAVDARGRAGSLRSEAQSRRALSNSVSPWGAAATSLLGSAGTVASSWYQLPRDTPSPGGNYQVGTPGYSGNYLHFDP